MGGKSSKYAVSKGGEAKVNNKDKTKSLDRDGSGPRDPGRSGLSNTLTRVNKIFHHKKKPVIEEPVTPKKAAPVAVEIKHIDNGLTVEKSVRPITDSTSHSEDDAQKDSAFEIPPFDRTSPHTVVRDESRTENTVEEHEKVVEDGQVIEKTTLTTTRQTHIIQQEVQLTGEGSPRLEDLILVPSPLLVAEPVEVEASLAPDVEAVVEAPPAVVEAPLAAEVEAVMEASLAPVVEASLAPEVEAVVEASLDPEVEAVAEASFDPEVEAVVEASLYPEVEAVVEASLTPEVEAVMEASLTPEVEAPPAPAMEGEVGDVIEVGDIIVGDVIIAQQTTVVESSIGHTVHFEGDACEEGDACHEEALSAEMASRPPPAEYALMADFTPHEPSPPLDDEEEIVVEQSMMQQFASPALAAYPEPEEPDIEEAELEPHVHEPVIRHVAERPDIPPAGLLDEFEPHHDVAHHHEYLEEDDFVITARPVSLPEDEEDDSTLFVEEVLVPTEAKRDDAPPPAFTEEVEAESAVGLQVAPVEVSVAEDEPQLDFAPDAELVADTQMEALLESEMLPPEEACVPDSEEATDLDFLPEPEVAPQIEAQPDWLPDSDFTPEPEYVPEVEDLPEPVCDGEEVIEVEADLLPDSEFTPEYVPEVEDLPEPVCNGEEVIEAEAHLLPDSDFTPEYVLEVEDLPEPVCDGEEVIEVEADLLPDSDFTPEYVQEVEDLPEPVCNGEEVIEAEADLLPDSDFTPEYVPEVEDLPEPVCDGEEVIEAEAMGQVEYAPEVELSPEVDQEPDLELEPEAVHIEAHSEESLESQQEALHLITEEPADEGVEPCGVSAVIELETVKDIVVANDHVAVVEATPTEESPPSTEVGTPNAVRECEHVPEDQFEMVTHDDVPEDCPADPTYITHSAKYTPADKPTDEGPHSTLDVQNSSDISTAISESPPIVEDIEPLATGTGAATTPEPGNSLPNEDISEEREAALATAAAAVVQQSLGGALQQFHNEAAQAADAPRPVELRWEHGGSEVVVLGSWSGWEDEHELTCRGSEHVASLVLAPGQYELKFRVDGDWVINTSMDNDGDNNVLLVPE